MKDLSNARLKGDYERVERTLAAADEVLLSELLLLEVTQDLTIRFLCGVVKLLEVHSSDVPKRYQGVKDDVQRVKQLIGSRRRSEAFEANAVHVPGWVPTHQRANPRRDLKVKRH